LTLTTFSNNQSNKICPVKLFEEGSEANFPGRSTNQRSRSDPIGFPPPSFFQLR
jgi:hypothetical protein